MVTRHGSSAGHAWRARKGYSRLVESGGAAQARSSPHPSALFPALFGAVRARPGPFRPVKPPPAAPGYVDIRALLDMYVLS